MRGIRLVKKETANKMINSAWGRGIQTLKYDLLFFVLFTKLSLKTRKTHVAALNQLRCNRWEAIKGLGARHVD